LLTGISNIDEVNVSNIDEVNISNVDEVINEKQNIVNKY
jgi:hypothetical protein